LTPVVALAQQSSPGVFAIITEYLDDGGPVMYVILLVSVVGAVIFLERAFDLFIQRRLATDTFMENVLQHIEARRFRHALDVCNVRSSHPLVPAVRAGVLRANRREKEIERSMEKEMLAALPGLQKRIAMLGLLANTATLIGLLGTIFGLITAFNSVAAATAAERQARLAEGISQAMYTTAFGISVAIPLLFFHHFLSKRNERIMHQVEEGASSLLVALAGRSEDATDQQGGAEAGGSAAGMGATPGS
jgi:biopolymer transport protein ExbB/TolQ